uniref:MULE transposase domain-containing protein n=1 Tax=Lactuca sativa TaxID=4236 RepID=A0A9R1XEN1_LACSA|nr:hypothetical protein LSAT_V11C500260020 [Lactuca sativa]
MKCLELQTNNPCIIVKLEVCNEPNPDVETRRHPGQILTAVGLDSNNGIYPLAYAFVEAETTSSWTWFLECLGGDLDLDASCNFTFVSDKQMGIMPVIAKVFPNCVRHIHENMKLQWRGEEFRDHLWRCATNTTFRHFETAMNEFQDFSAEAHELLSKIPPIH